MKPRIYVAGGFYGDYKAIIKKSLGARFDLFDPETSPDMGIPARYVIADLNAIENSRVILAVQQDYPYLDGLAAEVGYAAGFVRGITVVGGKTHEIDTIYVCLRRRPCSFLVGLARATFFDVDAACDFILQRYCPAQVPRRGI